MAYREAPMANLKTWLIEAETQHGETIEAIVVGRHDNRSFDPPLADENVILTREAGLEKVDEDYDNGYGGADCYPLYAWTHSWIFIVHEYDGATGLRAIPRNPMNFAAHFGGVYL